MGSSHGKSLDIRARGTFIRAAREYVASMIVEPELRTIYDLPH